MATKTAVTTAPGWWADPLLRHELRYYNGTAWTNHVLDKGVPDFDPLPVGLKLATPDPERQPFEPPGFSGVPADVIRKRRRRRAQLRSSMWIVAMLMIVGALVVSWFRFFDDKVDIGDENVPGVTVPTVPGSVPITSPVTVPPTATTAPAAPATTLPPPTAPPGTAIAVVTAAP